MRARRILVTAEMTGRELARRGLALGLLTALPLAFYVASTHSGGNAVITGGIAMAFSIAGASIFVATHGAAGRSAPQSRGLPPVRAVARAAAST